MRSSALWLVTASTACAVARTADEPPDAQPDAGIVTSSFARYTLGLDNGVALVAAGRGCADGFCIWLEGFNLSTRTRVVLKDHNWNMLHTYAGTALAFSLDLDPPQLSFVVPTPAERTELAANGVILTVVDHGTWDSIRVAP